MQADWQFAMQAWRQIIEDCERDCMAFVNYLKMRLQSVCRV